MECVLKVFEFAVHTHTHTGNFIQLFELWIAVPPILKTQEYSDTSANEDNLFRNHIH